MMVVSAALLANGVASIRSALLIVDFVTKSAMFDVSSVTGVTIYIRWDFIWG